MERTRRAYLRTMGALALAGAGTEPGIPTTAATGPEVETIRVSDESTIQDGVDEASQGDLVLVDPGTYEESVDVETRGITIRGTDRNEVVLDGEFDRTHGVKIEANGVALENLTARHYTGNAFYWRYVHGFRGSYLTAYNDGNYGIYAYRALDGRFEHCYASGHPDAGFYLGRAEPFDAIVTDVIAEHNALGYSGTSAGGNLTIRDSIWRHNMSGIVPNTLDEQDPPQRSCHIVDNEVSENHNTDAPNKELTYPMFGTGILVWGGNDNLIEHNEVRDHEHFGIAAQPNVDEPSDNVVRENVVSGSGMADLALGAPAGDDNEFADNEFETSLPADLERDASDGTPEVTELFDAQRDEAEDGDFPAGDWREQPVPDDRPTMPDPDAPPLSADRLTSVDPARDETGDRDRESTRDR